MWFNQDDQDGILFLFALFYVNSLFWLAYCSCLLVICLCEIIFPLLLGSGKSYLAKALRDLEVENGGSAPRIHSIDDYFMIEVEKVSGIAFKFRAVLGPDVVLFFILSLCRGGEVSLWQC